MLRFVGELLEQRIALCDIGKALFLKVGYFWWSIASRHIVVASTDYKEMAGPNICVGLMCATRLDYQTRKLGAGIQTMQRGVNHPALTNMIPPLYLCDLKKPNPCPFRDLTLLPGRFHTRFGPQFGNGSLNGTLHNSRDNPRVSQCLHSTLFLVQHLLVPVKIKPCICGTCFVSYIILRRFRMSVKLKSNCLP